MNEVAKSLARTTLLASLLGFAVLLLLRTLSGKWFWQAWLLPPVAASCATSSFYTLVELKPPRKALGWTLLCLSFLVPLAVMVLYRRFGMVSSATLIGLAGVFSSAVAAHIRSFRFLIGQAAEDGAGSREATHGREVGANGAES